MHSQAISAVAQRLFDNSTFARASRRIAKQQVTPLHNTCSAFEELIRRAPGGVLLIHDRPYTSGVEIVMAMTTRASRIEEAFDA